MKLYKKIFDKIPNKKVHGILSVFFTALASLLQMSVFWFLYQFLISIVVENSKEDIFKYAIIIFILVVSSFLLYFIAMGFSHQVAFALEVVLKKSGIRHLMDASFSFFDTHNSGEIRKKIDDNILQTHMIVAHLLPDLIQAIVAPIVAVTIMFMINYQLAILTCILIVLGGIETYFMMGDSKYMELSNQAQNKMSSEAVEYVRGMQVVKIFNAGIHSFKTFYETIVEYGDYSYEYTKTCRIPYTIFLLLFNICIIIPLPVGIYLVSNGADFSKIVVDIVFYACFSGILFILFMRIMYVGMYAYLGNSVFNSLESLFEKMNKNKLVYQKEEQFDNYSIEFKEVTFCYEDNVVLDNFNLKLQQGKTYALVGSSGSGKSTIAKLISGFYNYEKGEICIGDKPIHTYSKKALMENIAFVFQNAKLFKTSIYENVAMANPNASYEEVMKALQLARCEDILDKFETREKTIIGSKGVHLSGGEKQRIAIARAILKDAKIVILDEASGASDIENELEIQKAFANLMKDKTVIMIAHRLTSISSVDEILVMDKGKVIERGNHEQLLSSNSHYAHLHNLYKTASEWKVGVTI